MLIKINCPECGCEQTIEAVGALIMVQQDGQKEYELISHHVSLETAFDMSQDLTRSIFEDLANADDDVAEAS